MSSKQRRGASANQIASEHLQGSDVQVPIEKTPLRAHVEWFVIVDDRGSQSEWMVELMESRHEHCNRRCRNVTALMCFSTQWHRTIGDARMCYPETSGKGKNWSGEIGSIAGMDVNFGKVTRHTKNYEG